MPPVASTTDEGRRHESAPSLNASDSTDLTAARHFTWRCAFAVSGLLLMGALVSACQSDPSDRTIDPGVSRSPASPSVTIAPGATFAPSVETGALDFVVSERRSFERTLESAWSTALSDCAAKVGLDYAPEPVPEVGPRTGGVEGFFGLTSAERAAQFGYIADPTGLDPGDVGDPVNTQLSDVELQALDLAINGPPDAMQTIDVVDANGSVVGGITVGSGCLRDFYGSFFGSFDAFTQFTAADMRVQDARLVAMERLNSEPEYLGLLSEWAQCMLAFGYSMRTPFDGFTHEWDSPRPSESELKTAIADVECKEQTDFLPRARSLRASIDADVSAQFGLLEEIQLLRRLFDEAASRS